MMEKDQIKYFKTVLTLRLDELINHAGHTMSELVSQSIQEIGYIDRACVDTDQTLKLRIRSRESQLIKKIRAALDRVENNSYGICESCGEDISIKRLEARPVTTKCIHCKEEEEKQELIMQ
ncbi:RNA polymerase-binding protein DksA [Desulfobacula phenolica]|nr:RNA polymerase-binding protein DksA [Desulfobacula phenolica]